MSSVATPEASILFVKIILKLNILFSYVLIMKLMTNAGGMIPNGVPPPV